MEIPRHIEIKDVNGKRTAFLSPKSDGLKDANVDCRLNGESTLEFLLPATSEKIDELTPECQIWAGGRVYHLLKDDAIDTVRDDKNRLWAKFMAHERWYELDTSYVEPSISNDPTARPPADLAVIIVGGGSNLSGGKYATGTAAHALYAILQGSGWSMGTVDVADIRDLEAEKESRLALIKMVQDIWGGYLIFDSVNKVIHLRDPNKWQPYKGFQIRYRKNLKHITRTQSNRIITKLYPFGHDDLDIANVNNGEKFIVNKSYTSREYVGIYKNQDIYNQSELLEKAQAELELICRPRYLYKVKIVDVRVLPEYSHEDFKLGDMVDIIDPDIAPDSPRPRIIRHRYNLFQPWNCELDIGDPEERLIEQLKASFGTTQFIDGKFKGNGKFSGYSIEDLTIGDAKIRNLNAEKINAGYISADRIQAKSIGANKIKTDELVVGDNIQMGPNATISWGNVTNQPFIPDEDFVTTITEDTIMTTNVYARNLRVSAAKIEGILEADQITSNISRVNWSLEVGSPSESGEILLYGGGGSSGTYIDGHMNGMDIISWDGDVYMFADRRITLNAMNGIEINGGSIDILASSREYVYISAYGIILDGDAFLYNAHSDKNRVATWGDLDDSGIDNAITSYYTANWFYLDYGGGDRITVRNQRGTVEGFLYIE